MIRILVHLRPVTFENQSTLESETPYSVWLLLQEQMFKPDHHRQYRWFRSSKALWKQESVNVGIIGCKYVQDPSICQRQVAKGIFWPPLNHNASTDQQIIRHNWLCCGYLPLCQIRWKLLLQWILGEYIKYSYYRFFLNQSINQWINQLKT